MKFEWDEAKAAENLRKHGVSFDEAITVFEDPLFLIFSDVSHSFREQRYIIMGGSNQGRLLVVAYTPKKDRTRLISAKKATPWERKAYEEDI
jgi:uncharacterized DUF497 family protein